MAKTLDDQYHSDTNRGSSMGSWCSVQRTDQAVEIELRPSPDRFWPTHVLQTDPVRLGDADGLEVVISGSGAVWMYAHCAAMAAASGAYACRAQTPHVPGDEHDTTHCRSLLVFQGEEARNALLHIDLAAGVHFSEQAIRRLVEPRLAELERVVPETVAVSGRAPVTVYAEVSYRAVRRGVQRLWCWSARDGLVAVYDASGGPLGSMDLPTWLWQALPRPDTPFIVGVIGDPNRGKSVFSYVLDAYRQRVLGCTGWRLDCDGQSPTPNWYLSLRRQTEQTTQAGQGRKKITWTHPMERRIQHQLQIARRLFDVLIADLPGGNHSVQPPQRIPDGREIIFREVDAFILLDDHGGTSEPHWRAELKKHGLESRLVAVIRSAEPRSRPSLTGRWVDDVWRGNVTGLDRTWIHEKTLRVVQAFKPALDDLWQDLRPMSATRAWGKGVINAS